MDNIVKVRSFRINGNHVSPCIIECSVSDGIGIHLVGLADASTKESHLRVVTALQYKGYRIPGKKIIINVAPDARIGGSCHLDLPIAIALLFASGQVAMAADAQASILENCMFAGELGLNGSIRNISHSLQAVLLNQNVGLLRLTFLPKENALDAYAVTRDRGVVAVSDLDDVIAGLKRDKETCKRTSAWQIAGTCDRTDRDRFKEIGNTPLFDEQRLRAAMIAAAGGFGILCTGPYEANAYHMGELIRELIPSPDDTSTSLEIDKVLSMCNKPYGDTMKITPMEDVDANPYGIFGTVYNFGALPLVHKGVLLVRNAEKLDDATITRIYDVYRDKELVLKKDGREIAYPSDFLPVMTVNTNKAVKAYRSVDLLPMKTELHPLPSGMTPDARIFGFARSAVAVAQRIAYGRGGCLNARLNDEQTARLLEGNDDALAVIGKIVTTLKLERRERNNIIRIARTIADINNHNRIQPEDIGEAAGYVHHIK